MVSGCCDDVWIKFAHVATSRGAVRRILHTRLCSIQTRGAHAPRSPSKTPRNHSFPCRCGGSTMTPHWAFLRVFCGFSGPFMFEKVGDSEFVHGEHEMLRF